MRKKLIALFIMFLLLPSLLLSKIWFDKTSDTIVDVARVFNEQLVRQLNNQISDYFQDLERSTMPLIAHPLVKEFMLLQPDQAYKQFILTRDIQNELLQQIVFGRPEVYSLTIYSANGLQISNHVALPSQDDYESYLRNTELGNYNVMGIRWINNTPLLTITRKFTDTTLYQTSGVLVFNIRLNEIWNKVNKIQTGMKGKLWIIDSNNLVIYDSGHYDKLGSNMPDWFIDGIHSLKPDETFLHEEKGVTNIVNYNTSESTRWTIVSEFPIHEFSKGLIVLRDYSIWILLIITFVACIIIGGYAFYLTNSLSILERLMRKAQDGDLLILAPHRREKEIGSLFVGFNKMMGELRRLIVEVHAGQLREKDLLLRQKESMLRALQSQINPHFLYNTLEIINSHAILQGVMPVSRMATALADMFRYCMKDSMQVVNLTEELQHIHTYLEIQKERFPELTCEFHFDMTVASSISICRLSIQPLIENCFIHAYENQMLPPSFIGITGDIQKGKYVIRIMDQGRGMPDDVLVRFSSAFKNQYNDHENMNEGLNGHIGLINVHSRLRLTFGYPFGLHIAKSNHTGTIVEVVIPLEQGRKDESA
ncbi:sensor histidine kinase [Paenibacillus aceris]|uniref:Two-component system sensor histidine kinase YesM n=1 Tax=Paenibacillus aceris TaxID=869555 RepID=A0ABS4HX59_9BACL|nr:sensor histidine kinase [Paenibacillus aceris]MBP1963207.1 two-component system sensor histidine kinase YesM [Paenibacillus aceris]NHW38677.1 histidine kinase [Paenibacillus aceris]